METLRAASLIFAAGKGTRMTGYDGNKTLLPLLPGADRFTGTQPLLIEVLDNLPPGPKAIVVNHRREDVLAATRGRGLVYVDQPVTNGTGGALLAARSFLERNDERRVIVTMGDVPLVRRDTYAGLLAAVPDRGMAVLGFSPRDAARYGALETEGDRVARITEWKYWNDYPPERKASLTLFNAGIYAADLPTLLSYMDVLHAHPHRVEKERDGRLVAIEEYFITDLVEFMNRDGLDVTFVRAESEEEVMGVDTPEVLARAQQVYARKGS